MRAVQLLETGNGCDALTNVEPRCTLIHEDCPPRQTHCKAGNLLHIVMPCARQAAIVSSALSEQYLFVAGMMLLSPHFLSPGLP